MLVDIKCVEEFSHKVHLTHCLYGEGTSHLADTRFCITKHSGDEEINPARAEPGDTDS